MSIPAGARLAPNKATVFRLTLMAVALSLPPAASAFDFEWNDVKGTWTSKLTAGAGWRVERRDDSLIGKLNVPGQQTLCQADDCLSLSNDPAPNQRLIAARGDYSAHEFDDGNLNYDRWDPISGLVKLNTALAAQWGDFSAKVGFIGFYDAVNHDFRERHANTLLQPARTGRRSTVKDRVGLRGELREAFVQYTTEVAEHGVTVSIGSQRVRWGEANLHPLNTLDVINPQNAILPRQPGFATNELNDPTGLGLLSVGVVDGVTAELFYQYDWDATQVEPSGTFFSSNDLVGNTFIEAAPGQFAEDPDGRYAAPVPVSFLTSASRRVPLSEAYPGDGGQYGLRLNWYAEDLNDGTEFGFYYANYHSRLPYISVYESEQSCMRRAVVPGNFAAATAACSNATGVFNGTLQAMPSLATEPVPVDTERAVLGYPEDIHMFGVSFNTTFLGWSVSGEYAYRPNLPVQLQISDVLFAGVQQAFPMQDTPILSAALPGLAGTTIPGARTFVPDFISEYRGRTMANGNEFQPGEFIRGWERLKVGQFVLNGLKILPGHFGADDITVLVEGGFTHIVDLPDDLYFQGEPRGSHPGPGADGSGPGPRTTLRLNPTQQTSGFVTDFSWGLRALGQLNYSGVLGSNVNLKPTLIWFEDISGIAPFPAQNYVESNRWVTTGLQFQIGQNVEGLIGYMYFDGAKNALQDRDNVQISFSYIF